MTHTEYVPGVCNIGRAEIALRQRIGWQGLALTLVLWGLMQYFALPPLWSLVLFPPSFVASIGFIQAKMHFCAAFGIRSVLNFGAQIGKTDTVMQAEFRAQDRKKALQIIGYSLLAAILVTIVAWNVGRILH